MKKVLIGFCIIVVVVIIISTMTYPVIDVAKPESYVKEEDGNFFLYLFGKKTIQTEHPCSAEVVNLDPNHNLGGLLQLYFIRLTNRDTVILYLNREAVIELPIYFKDGSSTCP